MFRAFLCPSSGVIYCTHGNLYVSCRLCDHFLPETGWNLRFQPAWNVQVAVRTVDNSWWWAQRMPETCRVLWQNKFWIFDQSNWLFYTKKNMRIRVSTSFLDLTCLQKFWGGCYGVEASIPEPFFITWFESLFRQKLPRPIFLVFVQ
jgi:hypothetical protein